jgi:hypothetical protein
MHFREEVRDKMENEDNSKQYNLVEEVSEEVSTDVVSDLKTGIYNLFITLFNEYTIEYGPEKAIELSTSFLDDISLNFKSILDKQK